MTTASRKKRSSGGKKKEGHLKHVGFPWLEVNGPKKHSQGKTEEGPKRKAADITVV